MSDYQVLARKYRPKNFSELIGQEDLVKILSGAFASKRIPHAFLFTGIRGVGKTSTARLLARALNYHSLPEEKVVINEPNLDLTKVGVFCQSITKGNNPDVIEIDAASNTGVSDIREIIEAVQYKPMSCRYKIYIIDEVHMLSNAAFNALLKTLEEPPKHVIFILATTELRRIPVTILSRCQRFDLKRIRDEDLYNFLIKIIKLECLNAEKNAVIEIVKSSDGSIRDALSLLDQLVAYSLVDNNSKHDQKETNPNLPNDLISAYSEGETIIFAHSVRDLVGLSDCAKRWDLIKAMLSGDIRVGLDTFNMIYMSGAQAKMVFLDCLDALYQSCLMSYKKQLSSVSLFNFSPFDIQAGQKISQEYTIDILLRLYQFIQAQLVNFDVVDNMKSSGHIIIIQACHLAIIPSTDEILQNLPKQSADNYKLETLQKKKFATLANNALAKDDIIDDELVIKMKELFPEGKFNIVDK